MPSSSLLRRFTLGATLVAGALGLVPAARAQDNSSLASSSRAAIESMIDRLPELLNFGIPGFAPKGAYRLYARPRLGDLFNQDYFRLPVGARMQVYERIEFNTELGTYFTHGLRDSAGYGLYELRLGVKREQPLGPDSGWSMGLDFSTPLSRPADGISDGFRHTLPYVGHTRLVSAQWRILGFSTLAADLLDRTALPADFRQNQLHTNSLLLTVGVARDWPRFRGLLTASIADSTLLSRESKQVYALRPAIVLPILRRHDSTPRATLTFTGRLRRGPDGTDLGLSTSVRIDLKYRRAKGPVPSTSSP